MTTLVDLIVGKRLSFFKKLSIELSEIYYNAKFQPLQIWKQLMDINSRSNDHKDLIFDFFKRNSKKDYYKKLAESVKDPTDFDELLNNKIFYETYYDDSSFCGSAYKISSFIDEQFTPFIGTLKTFPWYYEKYEDRSCLGTALILSTLLYMKNKLKNAKFVEVYDTERRSNLIKALEMLEKGQWINKEKVTKAIERIEKKDLKDYDGKEIIIAPILDDYVFIDVDTIHGSFDKNDLKETIANSILSIEKSTHAIVKVDGKYIDFPMEWKNIKGQIEYDIEDGLFLFPYLNLLTMLKEVNGFYVREEFEKLYSNPEFRKSVQLNIFGLDFKKECKEYILDCYNDLPLYLKIKFYRDEGKDIEKALKLYPETLQRAAKEIYLSK
jgi:hypothetical protein